ncbi:MAG: FkbM family methyltransferase [Undibacterium sp.]|uniref:FkbM family methyltransferase n=1 Tax=Undibacterium sp. TaxID=1914977 RepID=UPI00271E13E4|nr:FkbM family methyltransferase [Undibacterium sp.]MDO8652920.1 FkbM family methyltransferase [Undibacterium sp.]
MKNLIKLSLKKIIVWGVNHLDGGIVGRYIYAQILASAMNRTQVVTYADVRLTFAIPNALNRYRSDTFSIKEPETLEWIDGIPSDAVLWDIGANVGLYSCYAAKRGVAQVFAFEPSVFNLELLARNIFLNNFTDQITIIPLPLSDTLAVSTLNMTSTEWGGALSTFGQEYGHDGENMRKVFKFPTIGISMVDAVALLKITQPDYIKMDVDGIEHLILKGGGRVLQNAKGVLIEINDKFKAQADDASRYLNAAGFVLKEKRHAEYFDSQGGSGSHTYNQIWIK